MSARSYQLDALFLRLGKTLPEQRLALLGEAISQAELDHDQEALYSLRRALFRSSMLADDPVTGIAAFSLALEQNRSDPARFPATPDELNRYGLEVEHGWAILPALGNPAVSRDQVKQLLTSLELLLRREGMAMHNLTYLRMVTARRMRDFDQLPARIEAASRIPPQTMPCEGCLGLVIATARLTLGDTAGALRAVKNELSSPSCSHSTVNHLVAALVVPLLRLGEAELAERYFRAVQHLGPPTALARLDIAGALLTVAALSDQVAYGLDLLERRLPDLGSFYGDHGVLLEFLTGAAMLLGRASRAGLGRRPVRDFTHALSAQGVLDEPPQVDLLAQACWVKAEQIASAFDARAGNTARCDWLVDQRTLGKLTYALKADSAEVDPVSTPAPTEPSTAWEWLERANQHYWLGESAMAYQAAQAAVSAQLGDSAHRCIALDYQLRMLAHSRQQAAGVTTVAALGDTDRSQIQTALAALVQARREEGSAGIANMLQRWGTDQVNLVAPSTQSLRAILAQQSDVDTEDLAELECALSRALLAAGELDEATALAAALSSRLDPYRDPTGEYSFICAQVLAASADPRAEEALTGVITTATPALSGLAGLLLSQWLLEHGDPLDAARAAQAAARQLLEIGAAEQAAQAYQRQGEALERCGCFFEALTPARRALELTEPIEGFNRLELQLLFGRLLVLAGRSDAAIGQLHTIDAELAKQGIDPASPTAIECAHWLGLALADQGEFEEAMNLLGVAALRAEGQWAAALAEARTQVLARYLASRGP